MDNNDEDLFEIAESSMNNEQHSTAKPQGWRSDPTDTLIVPPPTFRERLAAAQRARVNEVRPSVELPRPSQRLKTEPQDRDDV